MTQASQSDTRELTLEQLHQAPMITIRIGEQSRDLTYQQAFAWGHSLVRAKDFGSAAAIFEQLSRVTDRGPRSHIMLAICKAGLSDYKGSRAVLDSAFQGDLALLAAETHGVIVDSRMGFKNDALRELAELANEHKQFPTFCLWLGDLLEANHRLSNAVKCWKLAVKRDRADGAVALAARQQLQRAKRSKRPTEGGPDEQAKSV